MTDLSVTRAAFDESHDLMLEILKTIQLLFRENPTLELILSNKERSKDVEYSKNHIEVLDRIIEQFDFLDKAKMLHSEAKAAYKKCRDKFLEIRSTLNWPLVKTSQLMKIIYPEQAKKEGSNFRHWYQNKLKLAWLKKIDNRRCRIDPTCSKYAQYKNAIDAIAETVL